jgi:hypothetical protein
MIAPRVVSFLSMTERPADPTRRQSPYLILSLPSIAPDLHGVIAAPGPALVGNVALGSTKEDPMGTFVGLDVSLKATSVCVLDEAGPRVFEGKAAAGSTRDGAAVQP